MITPEDVFQIGRLGRPHGVKGEITFQISDDVFDRVDAEYDEKIAANEPDMSFELEEDDLAICGKSR